MLRISVSLGFFVKIQLSEEFLLSSTLFVFFSFFRAVPMAYRGSQAGGPIEAI